MLDIVDIKEQSFQSIRELQDCIFDRTRRDYVVSSQKVHLDEDGIFHAGEFEGRLTKPALSGLFNTLEIPENYGWEICTPDLLVATVEKLAKKKDISVRVQVINGVANGIMPADRQTIKHEMLFDFLKVQQPIHQVTLRANILRITTVNPQAEAVLPGDSFGVGWELLNNEDGWHSITASRFLVRFICVNGMIGFDKTAFFCRTYNSREPIGKSMLKLIDILKGVTEMPEIEAAVKWAADTSLGNQKEAVLDYMGRRLEGEVTKRALQDITNDSTWYDFMNRLTSLAKLHQLELRRKYEYAGGILLRWFMSQGHQRPIWKKSLCESCDTWMHN